MSRVTVLMRPWTDNVTLRVDNVSVSVVSQDDDVTSVSTDTGTTDLVAVSVRTIAALW